MSENDNLKDIIKMLTKTGDVMVLKETVQISSDIQVSICEEYELYDKTDFWKKSDVTLISYVENPTIFESYRRSDFRKFTTAEVLALTRGNGYEYI